MSTFLNTFRKIGGGMDITAAGIRFYHPGTPLRAIAVETDVHPGLMTDWQQPLVVALTQADGISIVHETVYENRLGFRSEEHTSELQSRGHLVCRLLLEKKKH